jgi:hypothetical protein
MLFLLDGMVGKRGCCFCETGGNLPEEFLSNIYASIRRNEIKLNSEAATNSLEVCAECIAACHLPLSTLEPQVCAHVIVVLPATGVACALDRVAAGFGAAEERHGRSSARGSVLLTEVSTAFSPHSAKKNAPHILSGSSAEMCVNRSRVLIGRSFFMNTANEAFRSPA